MAAARNVLADIEWVVACLAPYELAPHPNFNEPITRTPQLIALLAQGRSGDVPYYDRNLESSLPQVEFRLFQEISRSLNRETQKAALSQLISICTNQADFRLGMRACAFLFTAVAAAELDSLHSILNAGRIILEDANAVTPVNRSSRLLIAAISQQLAIRNLEIGDRESTVMYASQVLELLGTSPPVPRWDTFQTSRGTAKKAATVQVRISDALSIHARSLLVQVERPQSNRWVDIIRSDAPINDLLVTRTATNGTDKLIDDAFKSIMRADQSQLIPQADPVLPPAYYALLNAELTGSVGAIISRRSKTGKIVSIRAAQNKDESYVDEIKESLRLFRQADDEDSLKRLVRSARQDGPIDALKQSAQELIQQKVQDPWTTCDLILAENAAEFLSLKQVGICLQNTLDAAMTENRTRLSRVQKAGWSHRAAVIRMVTTLLRNTHAHDTPAHRIAKLISTDGDYTNQFVAGALVELSRVIEWDAVKRNTKDMWIDLASRMTHEDGVVATHGMAVLYNMGCGIPDGQQDGRPFDLERAVFLLNASLRGPDVSVDQLDRAGELVGSILQRITEEAANGSASFYSYSPGEVAAHLIKAGQTRLWDPLVQLLCDRRVPDAHRLPALIHLAVTDLRVPPSAASFLQDHWTNLATPNPAGKKFLRHGWADPRIRPAAMMFGIGHGLVSDSSAMAMAVELAGRSDSSMRYLAARLTSLSSARNGPSQWTQMLLLQFSRDESSPVRSVAAEALPGLPPHNIDMDRLIKERILELLSDDGLVSVYSVLRGLFDASNEAVTIPSQTRDSVLAITRKHPSRLVREYAAQVAGRWSA